MQHGSLLECYNQLAEKLNLGKSQKNYNIGVLDRICKTGQIGNLEKDSRFNHQNSFVSLDERIRLSYVGEAGWHTAEKCT